LTKKIPAGLVFLFEAIVCSMVLNLNEQYGIAVVGSLLKGPPSFSIPRRPLMDYLAMVLPAFGVMLVAFSEALGVAHEFTEKQGYEKPQGRSRVIAPHTKRFSIK
jgi:MFS superfamily sulfate permease-like transporter